MTTAPSHTPAQEPVDSGSGTAPTNRQAVREAHRMRGHQLRAEGKGDDLKSVENNAEQKPTWFQRHLPPFSFQALTDVFGSTLYFGRMFMYQFEVTYDYIRLRLSKITINGKVVLEDAAAGMRNWAKGFVGQAPEYHCEVTTEKKATVPIPKGHLLYVGRPKITQEEAARRKAEAAAAKEAGITLPPRSKGIIRKEIITYTDTKLERVVPLAKNWKRTLLGIFPFTRDIRGMRPTKEGEHPGVHDTTEDYFGQSVPAGVDRRTPAGEAFYMARNLTNIMEAIVFSALDFVSYRTYRKEMVRDLRDTIHLDSGKTKGEVTKGDLNRSSNPFIQSELGQNRWKYALRFIGDAAFAWGLKTGIILKLLPYPLEYTVFKEKTAFRSLKTYLKDVKQNHFGAEVEPSFALNLQRCVQQCLRDHHRSALSGEALEAYREQVIAPVAKLAVTGQLSLGEVVHVLGDVLSPQKRLNGARCKLEALAVKKGISLPASTAETELVTPEQKRSSQIEPARKRAETLARGPATALDQATREATEPGIMPM